MTFIENLSRDASNIAKAYLPKEWLNRQDGEIAHHLANGVLAIIIQSYVD